MKPELSKPLFLIAAGLPPLGIFLYLIRSLLNGTTPTLIGAAFAHFGVLSTTTGILCLIQYVQSYSKRSPKENNREGIGSSIDPTMFGILFFGVFSLLWITVAPYLSLKM